MKKIISVFLAFVLLLSTYSVAALALEPNLPTFHYQSEVIKATHLDPDAVVNTSENSSATTANKFYANGNASTPHKFYSYLDNNQKAVYNKILSNPLQEAYFVDMPEPIIFDAYVSEQGEVDVPDNISQKMASICIGGISAVSDDNPMIFWIYTFYYASDFEAIQINSNGTYRLRISTIGIANAFEESPYSSISEVTTKYNQLANAVKAFPVTGTTRYEKVKSIHDTIVKQAEYDPNFDNENMNPTAHEPTSALLAPFTTVCEGYAESFKLICDRENIPCIIVVGTGNGGPHAWNYVKMEDENWYAVDLTWDDQGDIYYDFFLVGRNTSAPNFGGETFSQSHVPNGQRFGGSSFSLVYPTLYDRSYDGNALNLKLEITQPVKNLYIKGEELDLTGLVVNAVYYNGKKVALDKSEYTVTGFDKEKIGEQTIKVQYRKASIEFKVNVVSALDPPATVNIESAKKNTISISWTAVDNATGYNVYVGGVLYNQAPITETNYLITGLAASTTYSILVKSVNSNGESDFGTEIFAKTTAGKYSEGDVSGDEVIDSADSILILRADAGLIELTVQQRVAADVTGDGTIDVADAIKIARYDAGLISKV